VSAARPEPGRVLLAGLRRGLGTGWFLARIMVPISAAVAALQWTGALAWIGRILAPAMGAFGLPGEAAIALVTGGVAGVYGAIAGASLGPPPAPQMTVLALMVLTAHNLLVESTVQAKSGTSGPRMALLRISVGLVLGALLWQILRHAEPGPIVTRPAAEAAAASAIPLATFALSWAAGAARLVLKIFVVIAALNVATELMRAYGVFDALTGRLRPVMRFLGLSERVAFLWLTANVLGLAFGAGLLIDETASARRYEPGELRDLHVSIAISHSLLEDTVLFLAVGASFFWIVAPRPVVAAIVVRAARRLLR
jgi:spore maturation protein SpmB